MGYRSEVAIKCEQKAFSMFKEAYKKFNFNPDNIFTDGEYLVLYWDWIKWYEGYEEIDSIIEVMDKLDELKDNCDRGNRGKGYGYHFLREDIIKQKITKQVLMRKRRIN